MKINSVFSFHLICLFSCIVCVCDNIKMNSEIHKTLKYYLESWRKSIFCDIVSKNECINYDPQSDSKKWIFTQDSIMFGKLIFKELKEQNVYLGGTMLQFLINTPSDLLNDKIYERICHVSYIQFELQIHILCPSACLNDELSDSIFVHPANKTLYDHQKNTIDYLFRRECEYPTKINYLTDKVGAGKTNIALSLCFHDKFENDLNLIIVPHHLHPQWKKAIEEYNYLGVAVSRLPHYNALMTSITEKKIYCDLTQKNRIFLGKLRVICITTTMYDKLSDEQRQQEFKRIFVDELTNFHISNKYQYLYYISATDDVPIEYPEFFTEKSQITTKITTKILVENKILKLPLLNLPYNFEKYVYNLTNDCLDINNATIMGLFINKFTNEEFNLKRHYKTLEDKINLTQVKLTNFDEMIRECELCGLDFENFSEYRELKLNLKYLTNDLNKVQTSINENTNTINHIKNKILAKECTLCLSEEVFIPDGYLITDCCNTAVCFECDKISRVWSNKCPYCRKEPYSNIPFLTKIEHNKHDTILKSINEIIKQKPDAKILIYAENVDNYKIIKENFKDKCIIPIGRPDVINKLLNEYNEAQMCKILLVNMNKMCAGFNLTCTTHLLILSDLKNKKIEEQIIGRCYRNGILHDLKIERILYENETDPSIYNKTEIHNYEEMFKSTDLDPIERFFNLGDFIEKTSGLKYKNLNGQVLLEKTKRKIKIPESGISCKKFKS